MKIGGGGGGGVSLPFLIVIGSEFWHLWGKTETIKRVIYENIMGGFSTYIQRMHLCFLFQILVVNAK